MKATGKILSALQRETLEKHERMARNLTIFGTAPNGRPWGEYLSAEIKETLEWDKDPGEDPIKIGKLYDKAHRGDTDAQHELQSLRIEQVNNYIIPVLNFGRYFEIVTLADNESPVIQNNTKQEFKVKYTGQDGAGERTKVVPVQDEVPVDLYSLETEEVEYRLNDLYTGNIAEAARATFDLAFDLKNQLEGKLWTLLNASFGNFVTTGKKSSRTFNLNSRIRSDILPTTNDVQITGIGASTKFGQSTLDKIMDHVTRFGTVDSSGNLMPTGEIIIPADNVSELGANLTLFGAKQTDTAEQVMRNGWLEIGMYMGINWRLIPDNTIAQKACYPVLNRPVGRLFLKPSQDMEDEVVSKRLNRANRWMKKVFGTAIPEPSRRFMLRVTYRS